MIKIVKRIVRYIKLYNEPDKKQLALQARQAAHNYYKQFDRLSYSLEETQYFQRGYINAYRRTYAKNQIAKSQQG